MFHRTLSAIAAAVLTVGVFAATAPAQAAPTDESVTVSLVGLNPGDPADADRIERRIRSAARDLCGSDLLQPVRMMQRAAACEKAAVGNAQSAAELAAARKSGPVRLSLRSN